MIKVVIERRCRPGKEIDMWNLLTGLRGNAMQHHGYVSGETLQCATDPSVWLVVSTWVDEQHWEQWNAGRERHEVMNQFEPILLEPERVRVFRFAAAGGPSIVSHQVMGEM
jgi:heme-degrading monooxygenase HmoA